MRLRYGSEEEAFRAELLAWVEANLPPRERLREPKLSSAHVPEWARAWQRTLFEAGWLVPGWPPELGGRNASPVEQMIYFEEFSKRGIPRSSNPQGLGIIAPSLRDYGTPAQREQFLLPTLRAEISWCLGMSEPGAGSDLASLGTRAVLDGGQFVVNGQKVWTSGAHHAGWCLCFVRTDPEAPKHQGISALIIDMATPGVEARPFPELSGERPVGEDADERCGEAVDVLRIDEEPLPAVLDEIEDASGAPHDHPSPARKGLDHDPTETLEARREDEHRRLVHALGHLRRLELRHVVDRKSTRLNSSHSAKSRMPSSA